MENSHELSTEIPGGETAETAELTATEHAGHGKPGMPQLDPSSFPSQLFWLAICFIALYVLMARWLAPRIGEVLEVRAEQKSGDLSRASSLKEESERLKKMYEETLGEARVNAQTALSKATQDAKDSTSAALKAKDEEISQLMAKTESAISQKREKALSDLKPAVDALATQIIEQVTLAKGKRA